jgi:hypothetical protein
MAMKPTGLKAYSSDKAAKIWSGLVYRSDVYGTGKAFKSSCIDQ